MGPRLCEMGSRRSVIWKRGLKSISFSCPVPGLAIFHAPRCTVSRDGGVDGSIIHVDTVLEESIVKR